jgi:RNA polymerase sigma-70 factor (ECF subfamily)
MTDNVFKLPGKDADGAAAERAVETRLLERVRDECDREAFGDLFERFTPRLVSWVSGQGCEPSLAESVVQDVMITAWTRAHLFNSTKASARTWIYTLARNRMIDYHRSGSRRARAYEGFAIMAPTTSSTADDPERDINRAWAADLLGELPATQRDIVLMIYVEGRTHREVSEMLDVPVGTVKSRTRLALQRLRKLMEERP